MNTWKSGLPRVHSNSGDPLPFESVEDGYVHEKWFVLGDEFGNRLYGPGL